MVELSETAKAALILHGAQKTVSGRLDGGSWWVIEPLKWGFIDSLPAGPEHSFILALINAECERRRA
jgi:hypothetical protein